MSRYCSPILSRAARTASAKSAPAPLRKTQSIGNQASLARLQTRLTIGAVNDPLEHEADQVADRVMRMPAADLSLSSAPAQVSRKCAACEEEDKQKMQRKETAGASPGVATAPPIVGHALNEPGAPLDSATRSFFEPRFGFDFSSVRVHVNSTASQSAQATRAEAYAVGDHIVFGANRYAPSSASGRQLLAHELAHVVQQSGGAGTTVRRQSKSFGGPLDLKPDPCVYAPVVNQGCAQSAVKLCENAPSAPGCDFVCSKFGCKKPDKPNYACKGLRAATSQDFVGQCCTGTTDSADTCCPPSRLAMNPTPHCCSDGETLDPSKEACVKVDSILPATALCPPERMTPSGKCCTPPQVSDGLKCADPAPGAPKPAPQTPLLSFGPVFTQTVHFLQDHPAPGETSDAAILTSEGVGELGSVQATRRLSPDLQARLIGKASSEGDTAYNQLLSDRRVGFIKGKIPGKFGEPLLPDSETAGCRALGVGLWSCGESKSDQKGANPDDRVVTVTFIRNALPPAQLKPPSFGRPAP